MLRVLDIPKGEWLIQTAAGSSLGRIIIKVAKHKGVRELFPDISLMHGQAKCHETAAFRRT